MGGAVPGRALGSEAFRRSLGGSRRSHGTRFLAAKREATESLRNAVNPPEAPTENIRLIRAKLAEGWNAPVGKLVGFTLTEIDADRAVITLEVGPQHANPMGTLHGGIMCDVADAAMGMAYASGLEPSQSFTTVEMKINFLRPVWSGRLRAEGLVLRRGRSVGLVQCHLRDESRELVAFATCTCMTVDGSPKDGLVRPRRAPASPEEVTPG
jgi:uncharacterized protein (TIGR00369 family)